MKNNNSFFKKLIYLLLVIVLLSNNSTEVQAKTKKITVKGSYSQTDARTMLSSINELRTGDDSWYWNGGNTYKIQNSSLKSLKYDYTLEKIAMTRAIEIAVTFSHTRPNGKSCWTAYTKKLKNSAKGENIAAGYDTVEEVYEAWEEEDEKYNGQGHRRNMLSKSFKYVGIAHVVIKGRDYWVQEFSSKKGSTSYTSPKESGFKAKVTKKTK